MIVPDLNLLVYAYDASSAQHRAAAAWWEGCMNGPEEVGLASVVVFGFLRLATHPRAFSRPLAVDEAIRRVDSWLVRSQVRELLASPRHVRDVMAMLSKAGTGGNLSTDAQIAALARQENAVIHTNDTDFHRFPGLHLFNPLTRIRSRT